jgi:O-antigen ligase
MGLLLTWLPVAEVYVTRFLEGLQGVDRATQMRFGEYKDALILIRRYPWIGVGFADTPDIDTYIGVSMVYLLIAEEMGVLGLTVFLLTMLAFLLTLAHAWLRLRRDPQQEALILGIGGAVVGLLVGGIFDHYLFNLTYPHMTSLFWLTLGLGIATSRCNDKENANRAEFMRT